MKTKFLLSVIITCLFVMSYSNSHAQAKTSFQYYSKETLDAVGASPEQQREIGRIKKDTDRKINAVRSDASLAEEGKKQKYKEIYSAGSKAYFEALNDEQQALVKRLYKEFQDKRASQK